jgi:hypothetical protein
MAFLFKRFRFPIYVINQCLHMKENEFAVQLNARSYPARYPVRLSLRKLYPSSFLSLHLIPNTAMVRSALVTDALRFPVIVPA